tara:strand:+ start:431 stop:847 length:417 start_codon:yes stop_codon:yes gene_type:complete
MKFLRNLKPVFFENSRIPVWLSYIAPLEIGAICLGPVVFARGTMNDVTKRHETIHFQQCLDTLFIGTVLLYAWDWLHGRIKYHKSWQGEKDTRGYEFTSAGNKAYHRVRAEQEAYDNEKSENYLNTRKRWQWLFKYSV